MDTLLEIEALIKCHDNKYVVNINDIYKLEEDIQKLQLRYSKIKPLFFSNELKEEFKKLYNYKAFEKCLTQGYSFEVHHWGDESHSMFKRQIWIQTKSGSNDWHIDFKSNKTAYDELYCKLKKYNTKEILSVNILEDNTEKELGLLKKQLKLIKEKSNIFTSYIEDSTKYEDLSHIDSIIDEIYEKF